LELTKDEGSRKPLPIQPITFSSRENA